MKKCETWNYWVESNFVLRYVKLIGPFFSEPGYVVIVHSYYFILITINEYYGTKVVAQIILWSRMARISFP